MELTYIDKSGLIKVKNNKFADDNVVIPNKGRSIDISKPIRVYRNLHKKVYSIKQGNLVVAHSFRLCLRDFKTIVSKKGREKVLIDKRKNVHAFLEGYYETSGMGTTAARNDLQSIIQYNPYKHDYFFCGDIVVNGGKFCILDENGVKGAYLK